MVAAEVRMVESFNRGSNNLNKLNQKLAGLATLAAVLVVGLGVSRADVPPGPGPRPAPKPKPTVVVPEPAPDTKPAEVAPAAAPEVAVRIPTQKATRLADGVYAGPVTGMGAPGEIHLTVVRGFIIEAFIRRTGEGLVPFDLSSVGVSNAAGIRLQGSAGNEFIRINGEIIDAERGRGTFDGVLVRKQVTGTWSVSRR